jgi:hypothetical protein
MIASDAANAFSGNPNPRHTGQKRRIIGAATAVMLTFPHRLRPAIALQAPLRAVSA